MTASIMKVQKHPGKAVRQPSVYMFVQVILK
jgi:hypothetical protein